MVLIPDRVHVSRSLEKRIKRQEYTLSFDQAFNEVIHNCSSVEREGQQGTWIGGEMIAAYQQLFKLGYAHSVEAWYEGELVGGLYGIAIGRVFFGESMFSLRSDASKVAFVHLARQLDHWGFPLIDCQVTNPHLISLGAEEIDRDHFLGIIEQHIDQAGPGNWSCQD